MSDEMKSGIEALRDKAWAAVQASEPYGIFAALDAAVVAAGGASALNDRTKRTISASLGELVVGYANSPTKRKVSQGDAAFIALSKIGEPLPVGKLMEAATNEGATIGGSDPLANFRSTISKDHRFRSIMQNNMYFWWFADKDLPPKWYDPEPDDFDSLYGSGSSESSGQEGGDRRGASTT
ncbi:hypothetical protein KY084_12395 [Stakelama sp. CBK3Z-3]|uniref:Uncharacterized protein n=1 Tax=Stakelama flava TaxID=2860338 RepID=A0ABS6XP68_9SPHN|nr:hypothetical protein [Stakelama flava]MBW4331669.1 hypothetical protein [Stakelama flava]